MENNGILKSFDLQDDLNPKIWKKNSKGSYTLSPEVREKLLEIAYEFIESLKVDVIVSDVHLTGSLVNFNWSQYSDFDLHIIADFNQFPKKSLPLYEELFKLKKTIFNSEQNIKIYGYDVEVFVQDENEKGHSAGIFSLISNDWLEKPKKEKFEVNKTILKKKIDQWTEKIDKVLESAQEEKDLEKSKKLVSNLKEKLKDYRKIGLEKGGEMSYENLVFKYLRRSGHIEKLFSFKKEKLDKELSLKEYITEQDLSFLKKLEEFLKKLFGIDVTKKPDTPETKSNINDFYKKLEEINEIVYQQSSDNYSYEEKVKLIQIALTLLDYKLEKGVDGIYGPDTANAVESFKKNNNIKEYFDKFGLLNTKVLMNEKYEDLPPIVDSYPNITFAERTKNDRLPKNLLDDIQSAANYADITIQVDWAKTGHRKKSASGYISRHWDGWAVDLSHVNGKGWFSKENAKKSGIYDGIEKFVSYLKSLGYKVNSERGNDKAVLYFGFDSAHNNHIHVSNKSGQASTQVGTPVVPSKPTEPTKPTGPTTSLGSYVRPSDIKIMIKKLKEKNTTDEDLNKLIVVAPTTGKPSGSQLSTGTLTTSDEIIGFFIGKGLSKEQSSGIAGNLFAESGFKTDVDGDGGTSYGLAQWHATRKENFLEWAKQNNYDKKSIKGQLEYIWHELLTSEKSAYKELSKTKTPSAAASTFAKYYERPASADYSERVKFAEEFYKKYKGGSSIVGKIESKPNTPVVTSGKKKDLPQKIISVLEKLEKKYNVTITDDNISKEFAQEGQYYEDAGGINSQAKEALKKLLTALYQKFPSAPKSTNSNCDNIPGCVSGYRGYNTQVTVFGDKIGSGTVAQRQKVSALPGFSQHHTGKTFDILDVNDGFWNQNTNLKKWVADNCGKFGFKVSYQTQGVLRSPEPWHLYYIGGSTGDYFVNNQGVNLKQIGEGAGLNIKRNTGIGKTYNESIYKSLKKDSRVRWAVYDIDRNTLLSTSSNGSSNIYGASVLKVIAAAAAFDLNKGKLSDSDYQKIMKLLVVSNNDVWDSVQNLAGGNEGVNKWAANMGYTMKPARRAGGSVNAVDMCKFWADSYNNKYIGSDSIIKITSSCGTSSNKSRAYLPKDVYVGGKTGTWSSYNHDSAWIKGKNGLYSITVLTELGSGGTTDVGQMFGGLYDEYCT